jgi:arylsulfatase A-like enzyme
MTLLLTLLFGCTCNPGPVAPTQPEAKPPNVLVVLWDTARADRMSLYGHSRPTTPWAERFAEQAVVYERAVASSEWTAPTHASLFTGLAVRTHGVDTFHTWLDGHHTTLAEHFGAHGYDTYAFTGNRFVSPWTHMTQGFETVQFSYQGPLKERAEAATMGKLIATDASTEISPAWQPHGHGDGWSKKLTLYKDAAPVASEALLAWLDGRDKDAPFVAFLNLMEAHQPRIPSMESRKALMSEEAIALALKTDSTLFRLMAYTSGKHEYTEAELAAMAGTYDAALLDLDKATGALMGELASRDLLDNTIVVLTADHGELLGEHHMYSHRWALYEPLIRVPLVVRYPAALAPQRVAAPVSTSSVLATLTELAGLPSLPGVAPSLTARPSPFVVSELLDPNRVMPIITNAFPEVPADQFARSLVSVVEPDWKLISASDDQHELYAIGTDPAEHHNQAEAQASELARLHGLLSHWVSEVPAYDPSKRTKADKPVKPMDQATRKQLEVLGYMD